MDAHERHLAACVRKAAVSAFGLQAPGPRRAQVDEGVWALLMARRRVRGWRQARRAAAGCRGSGTGAAVRLAAAAAAWWCCWTTSRMYWTPAAAGPAFAKAGSAVLKCQELNSLVEGR